MGGGLIAFAIEAARRSKFHPLVVLSSEDEEILSVAGSLGAIPHRRPAALSADDVPLDGVVHEAWEAAARQARLPYDVVVTIQPTAPLIRSETIDKAIELLLASPDVDTILTAVDDRHLRWSREGNRYLPLYRDRVNRQALPPTFRETGGMSTRASSLRPENRLGSVVQIIVVEGPEAIDIDSAEDWALCEWYLGRRDILFVVTGNPTVGLGHAYNAMAVTDGLVRHRVRFLVEAGSELAAEVIRARNYEVHTQRSPDILDDIVALAPDIVINEILDTAVYMQALKGAGMTVVNFEDLGPGARLADLVINAIYPERNQLPNHYAGPRYYCPRPEFIVSAPSPLRQKVQSVLVTFGGTDPNDLTSRTLLAAILPTANKHGIRVRVVLGLGYGGEVRPREGLEVLRTVGNMAALMRAANLVFTSGGAYDVRGRVRGYAGCGDRAKRAGNDAPFCHRRAWVSEHGPRHRGQRGRDPRRLEELVRETKRGARCGS